MMPGFAEDLLSVNDELNNAFLRYDRYHRLRSGQTGMQAPGDAPLYPPEPVNGYAPPPGYPVAQGMPMPAMPMRAMPMPTLYDNAYPNNTPAMSSAATQPRSPAVANLIDFDEGSSDPVSREQPIYSTIDTLDNLTLGSADDFDALAHSRQTTQPTLPKDENDWSQSRVKESDFLEMQQWLIDNPSSNGGGAASDTATPLEFERFLSRRQEEAQNLPPASKKLEPIKDEPLFSL